jgi:GxxExxY protein
MTPGTVSQIVLMPIAPGPLEHRDPRTHQIIGAAMAVHRELGPGFLEPVYQEALRIEFDLRGIPSQQEYEIPVHYRGFRLGTPYRADFLCYGDLLVELKALDRVTPREQAQVIHYLKALKLKTGLLINFGNRVLEFKRFLNPAMHVQRDASSG